MSNEADDETKEAADPSALADAGGSSPPEKPPEYVGPGFPPRRHRWKPGQPSPNPRGRPRKNPLAPDLKKAIEAALARKIQITRGERTEMISLAAAGIEQLANQYAKGDRHARRDMIALCEKFGIDIVGAHRKEIEEALAPDRQAILDAYVARQSAVSGGPEPEREVAPPELRDDDVVPETRTPPQPVPPKPVVQSQKPAISRAAAEFNRRAGHEFECATVTARSGRCCTQRRTGGQERVLKIINHKGVPFPEEKN